MLKNVDHFLLFIPVLFAAISLVMISSTSYTNSFQLTRDIIVQGIAFILGGILIFILLLFDYERIGRSYKLLYILSIVSMLLVYTPLGIKQEGALAWINLGFTTLQPCEFVKIFFTVFYAKYLSEHSQDLQSFKGLIKTVFIALPIVGIIAKEDLGNALVFLFMIIMMIFIAGVNVKLYVRCALAAVVSLPVIYFMLKPHQKQRIDAFLNPNDISLPGNWQVWNSKVAIGSGGLRGKGLFQGTQKSLDFLPVAKSDFIFAVICEEFGFVGGSIVILIYGFFIYRIIRLADKTKDLFGMLIVTGIGSMFFFQLFENVGMTMGIMPVTGITLPFISSGGTSVLANMIALGVLLSVGARSKVINF